MTSYVALFRGLNVGKSNRIKMQDLAKVFEAENLKNIETYIQSGNVLFNYDGDQFSTLKQKIIEKLASEHGIQSPLLIRSIQQLSALLQADPFPDKPIETKHLTFLAEEVSTSIIENIRVNTEDSFVHSGAEIYLHCLGKYHQTKLSNTFWEKNLGVTATTRNWKTVLKLVELMKG